MSTRKASFLHAGPVVLRPEEPEDLLRLWEFRNDQTAVHLWRSGHRPVGLAAFQQEEAHLEQTFYGYKYVISGAEPPFTARGIVFSYAHSSWDFKWTLYLAPDSRNLGLAVHAARAFLDRMFELTSARAARAEVYGFNSASLRLLRAVGAAAEGEFRECVTYKGELHSKFVLTLYRSSWESVKNSWQSYVRTRTKG